MTLFISGIEKTWRSMYKTALHYLMITVLCILFGAVYESFSHGVFSYYMLYAFCVPLSGGVIPFLLIIYFRGAVPGKTALNLYHSGIATLTVGCFFQGVLEIYGTTNRLILIYWGVGVIFLLSGIVVYVAGKQNVIRKER